MLQQIVEKALIGLREELAAINDGIAAMERIKNLRPTKGRPPKNLANLKIQATAHEEEIKSIVDRGFKPAHKKSKFSAATRKKMAAAQRKRWAQVKKTKKVLTMKSGKKVA